MSCLLHLALARSLRRSFKLFLSLSSCYSPYISRIHYKQFFVRTPFCACASAIHTAGLCEHLLSLHTAQNISFAICSIYDFSGTFPISTDGFRSPITLKRSIVIAFPHITNHFHSFAVLPCAFLSRERKNTDEKSWRVFSTNQIAITKNSDVLS